MRYVFKIILLVFLPVLTNAQEGVGIGMVKLDSVMKAEPKPIVILLTTEWCKYCRMQKVLLQKNSLHTDKVYFTEFDAETNEPVTFNGKIYNYKPTGIDTGVNELAIMLAGSENRPPAYPAWVVVDKNYKPVYVYQGVLQADSLQKLFEAAENLGL